MRRRETWKRLGLLAWLVLVGCGTTGCALLEMFLGGASGGSGSVGSAAPALIHAAASMVPVLSGSGTSPQAQPLFGQPVATAGSYQQASSGSYQPSSAPSPRAFQSAANQAGPQASTAFRTAGDQAAPQVMPQVAQPLAPPPERREVAPANVPGVLLVNDDTSSNLGNTGASDALMQDAVYRVPEPEQGLPVREQIA